jgi:hypothetical protein
MQERMKNPAVIIPDALKAAQDLNATIFKSGAPASRSPWRTRASQINGCVSCGDSGGCTPDIVVDLVAAGCGSFERAGR